jgi:hypothetical protein
MKAELPRRSGRGGRALPLALALALIGGCATTLPPRSVIEHDLGAFAYRRYQKSLDIEVPIPGNEATGHTASYLRRDPAGRVSIATAFVTVYQHARSLAAEARAALSSLAGYTLAPTELAGASVWQLEGSGRERWCVWVSERRVIKIGVQAGQPFPEELLEAYLELYPSDLDEHGWAKPDAPSAGPAHSEEAEAEEPELRLRDTGPT